VLDPQARQGNQFSPKSETWGGGRPQNSRWARIPVLLDEVAARRVAVGFVMGSCDQEFLLDPGEGIRATIRKTQKMFS